MSTFYITPDTDKLRVPNSTGTKTRATQPVSAVEAIRRLLSSRDINQGDTLEAKVIRVKSNHASPPEDPASSPQSPTRSTASASERSAPASSPPVNRYTQPEPSSQQASRSSSSPGPNPAPAANYQVTLKLGGETINVMTDTPLKPNDVIRLLVQGDQTLKLVEVLPNPVEQLIQQTVRSAIASQTSLSPVIANLLQLRQLPITLLLAPPAETLTPKLASQLFIQLPQLLQQLSEIVPTPEKLLESHNAIKHLYNQIQKELANKLPTRSTTPLNQAGQDRGPAASAREGSNSQRASPTRTANDSDTSRVNLTNDRLNPASLAKPLSNNSETAQSRINPLVNSLNLAALNSSLKGTLIESIQSIIRMTSQQVDQKTDVKSGESGAQQALNKSESNLTNIAKAIVNQTLKSLPADTLEALINQKLAAKLTLSNTNLGPDISKATQIGSAPNETRDPKSNSLLSLRLLTSELGQFLEKHIKQTSNAVTHTQLPSETASQLLGRDLKGVLLKLHNLFQQIDQQLRLGTPQDMESIDQTTAQLKAIYGLTLYQSRLSGAKPLQTINQSTVPGSLLSIFSSVTPPLSGLSFFTSQPPVGAQLRQFRESMEASEKLSQSIQKALSRISLTQWQNLQNWTQTQEAGTPRNFSFEIPVQDQQQLQIIQCQIEKREYPAVNEEASNPEGNAKKVAIWHIALKFDVEPLGPLFLQLSMQMVQPVGSNNPFDSFQGEPIKASAQIWAEKAATVAKAEQHLNTFKDMLTMIGLDVQSVKCQQGEPPEQKSGIERHLVDIKT